MIGSARHAPDATIVFGDDYERRLAAASTDHPLAEVDPEDPLVILYTSGTTGTPKGATISHRAQIVRNLVTRAEFGVAQDDTFVAWSPLYHMGAVDNSLGTLMTGGTVFVVDGFDAPRLADLVATEPLGWLLLMPGMVGRFADELESRGIRAKSVKLCGVMADLVPPAEIARITTLLRAPYANTFGATETGCPPCSSSLIPIGVAPTSLEKGQSPFCEIRLVDPDDRDVPDGSPGELAMRGPTLFSGYWNNPETNAHDFRGGWFHMGDVFVRHPDGSLELRRSREVPHQDRRRERLSRRDRARDAARSTRRRSRGRARARSDVGRDPDRIRRTPRRLARRSRPCSRCAAPSSPASSSQSRSASSPRPSSRAARRARSSATSSKHE